RTRRRRILALSPTISFHTLAAIAQVAPARSSGTPGEPFFRECGLDRGSWCVIVRPLPIGTVQAIDRGEPPRPAVVVRSATRGTSGALRARVERHGGVVAYA